MATRRPRTPAPQVDANGRHPVAALPPLPLDPARVAEVGALRAAVDAVALHPVVLDAQAYARQTRPRDMAIFNLTGALAARTAQRAHDDPAPFRGAPV
ncbi:hypothetical protein N1027_10660 [Herbiconiux sp. CPCC 205763]|uniref:Uncharacterized protein n=1 Tax=Herbiconiux aconitum TaxID=2970913 RepID=A0ABT2GUH7_9MICO|nr:hypothetical protein [Herbiconiux aconitum]MCS5718594.1 hypothetical protein [Herbiconiux aconitum]